MLNRKRRARVKVPEELRPLAETHVRKVGEPHVVFLDNRLATHFGHLAGWYSNRHPKLAGYQVIACETARFLSELIPKRQ